MGMYRQLRFWKELAAQIGMSSRGLVCRARHTAIRDDLPLRTKGWGSLAGGL